MPKGRLLIDRLPVGRSIDQAEFDRRHRLATLTLGMFAPVVFAIGLASGYPLWHAALETVAAAALATFARSTKSRLAGSLATSAGLVGLSTALVHFTGGLGESHLAWLVTIGLIGLYVDARPLLVGLGLIATTHVAFAITDPSLFFEHAGGQENPLRWSTLHLLILVISTGPILANWLTMEAWSEQAKLKERAQAHTLRHRAMVAADATGRTGELSVSSASVRKAMGEADELVASINEGTNEVSRLVSEVATLAQDADVMSSSTKDTIEHLSEQSSAISGLVAVIDDIAARTNLLALNASIEAARAGEAGKGFAVVAQEVKDLATTTGEATEQISTLTTSVQVEMDEANRRMAEVSDTVRSIASLQRQVDATMVDQTEASERMSRQVNEAATEMIEIIEGIDDLNELLEEDAADDPTDAFNAIHGTEAVSLSKLVR